MTTSDGLRRRSSAAVCRGRCWPWRWRSGLSPLAPIGAVAARLPGSGSPSTGRCWVSDAVLLVVVLGATAVADGVPGVAAAPLRPAAGETPSRPWPGRRRLLAACRRRRPVGSACAASGPASRARPAPVRSAVLGAVLAVVVVVASFIFGASLNSLVSQPEAVRVELELRAASRFLRGRGSAGRADGRPGGTRPGRGPLGGVFSKRRARRAAGPVLAERPNAAVLPTPLSGHALQVGPPGGARSCHPRRTAQAHRRHRRSRIPEGSPGPAAHRRDGDVPTIGGSGNARLQMGNGAVLATSLFPARASNQQGSPVPGRTRCPSPSGPGSARRRPGVRSTDRPAILNRPSGGTAPVSGRGVRPPTGRDRRLPRRRVDSFESWPGSSAAGAMAGLALTLVASVRRRATGVRAAQGSRLHPAAAGDDGGVAVLGVAPSSGSSSACPSASPSGGGSGLCSPGGSRPSPIPRCRSCRGARGARGARLRQPGGHGPRAYRRPHLNGALVAGGVRRAAHVGGAAGLTRP